MKIERKMCLLCILSILLLYGDFVCLFKYRQWIWSRLLARARQGSTTKQVSSLRATVGLKALIQFRSGCLRHHRRGSKSAIVRTSQLATRHESATWRTHRFHLASRSPRSLWRCRQEVSTYGLIDNTESIHILPFACYVYAWQMNNGCG